MAEKFEMRFDRGRWKFALVGLGAAARSIHLPAYSKEPSIEVVGGHDLHPADDLRLPFFGDFQQMLEQQNPDVVVVATPPETHFHYARTALLSGCHVICEKPLASTIEEAETLADVAKSSGRHLVVNNQYRFMKIHSVPQSLIGTESFGTLRYVKLLQTFRCNEETEKGWRGCQTRRTCLEFGTHAIDLCRFFFGSEPERMTASLPRISDSEPDLLNLIQLDFPGARTAFIELNRLTRGPHRYLEARLDGSESCIETRLGGGVSLTLGLRGGTRRPYCDLDASMGGWARLYRGEEHETIARESLNPFSDATLNLVRAFLRALDAGTVPPCDITDNIKTFSLMLKAYEQAGY